jgi:hypothetical protein
VTAKRVSTMMRIQTVVAEVEILVARIRKSRPPIPARTVAIPAAVVVPAVVQAAVVQFPAIIPVVVAPIPPILAAILMTNQTSMKILAVV